MHHPRLELHGKELSKETEGALKSDVKKAYIILEMEGIETMDHHRQGPKNRRYKSVTPAQKIESRQSSEVVRTAKRPKRREIVKTGGTSTSIPPAVAHQG